jgi:hypothetical protein
MAALGTLAVPVALVRVPPLLDYPNHLARIWLLAGGIGHPPLDAIYVVDWSGASTNIGIDLLAATIGHLVGGLVLAPLLLVAALILPPLGASLLNRAVFGGWHWWQVGFAALAWNSTLLAGFLNFQIGLGLALLAAAADPAIGRRTGPLGALAVRAVLGGILLVFHIFAAGFYGVLLAGLAFGPDRTPFTGTRTLSRAALRSMLAAGSGVGLPLAVFLLVAPVRPGGRVPEGVYDNHVGYTLVSKLVALMSAIATYDLRADIAVVVILWTMARLAASGPLLRIHAGLVTAAVGLLALALLVPSEADGTAFVDWRFPIMAALTLVAALRPGFRSARAGSVAACILLLVVLARTGWMAGIWQQRQADVTAVERALALVPPGAAVLPAEHVPDRWVTAPEGRYLLGRLPSYWHYPALAIPQRRAFVPTLFTTLGKQPLRVLPPWDSISVPEGRPAPVQLLRSFVPSPAISYQIGYVANWRERFDYVLVMNADLPDRWDERSLPELEPLADEGFARLYRIRRAPAIHGGSRSGR